MGRGVRRAAVGALLVLVAGAWSLALGLGPRATAEPEPSAARLESFEMPGPPVDPTLPGGRLPGRRTVPKVNVLLPAGYDTSPGARYPVLWLLHGANGGADSWKADLQTVLAGVDAVIVMPDGGMFGMYTDWWNDGHRGAPAWATQHLVHLREEVEQRYRIRDGRRWHALAGISMGGQGALRYAALLPGYFGSVAALSAALPDIQTVDMQVGLAALMAAGSVQGVEYERVWGPPSGAYAQGNSPAALLPNYEHTRVFLVAGNGVSCPQDPIRGADSLLVDTITETGIHLQQRRFASALRAAGVDVTDSIECGIHTFGVWERAWPVVRAWGFFERVPDRPTSWTYRTIAAAGEAWGLQYRFAAPPSEVVELRRAGDVLSVTGTGRLDVRGPEGCRLTLALPFAGKLPPSCWARH